jgi:hypothetical protein
MDKAQRKAMVAEWRLRRPEMGVISIRCKATGESFLGISKDTKADFNSNRAKLASGNHPNKRLTALWAQYGKDGFEWSVLKTLDYEDPNADHTAELEKLREECLAADPKAAKIWK